MIEQEHKFMKIIQRAIGQHMTNETPITEAIAEQCEQEKVDVEEIGLWIKEFKSLLQTVEKNAKIHNLLNEDGESQTTISLSELFE